MSEPSALSRILAELAAELPDAIASTGPDAPGSGSAPGTTTWARDGVPFTVLGPTGIEFQLDAAVAAAAIRTPDAAPSPRGKAWVRFNPRVLDGHAVDRLQAWFALAYRRASE